MLVRQNEQYLRFAEVDPAFRHGVLKGLSVQLRAIPARWLRDRRGSELFDAITALPDYYWTRTERSILSHAMNEIAALAGPERASVEFGSGSAAKTRILLSEVSSAAYVPIDISGEFLRESAAALSAAFPDLLTCPVEGDFTGTVALPEALDGAPRFSFFPGSTIGNLVVPAALDLLRVMAATLGPSSMLLIGIDRIKDTPILLPAYDDADGVTAAFNLNLLHRSVPVDGFRHCARWNKSEARIEMHLEAIENVQFTVAGLPFSTAMGERRSRELPQIQPAWRLCPAARRWLDAERRLDPSEPVVLTDPCKRRDCTIGTLDSSRSREDRLDA
jgi:dimethylhistidine N-methyltransferase